MKNVGILKYSLTVESLLEILTNKQSKLIDAHSLTNVIKEYFFNTNMKYCELVSMIFFSSESVVNNLKEKKIPTQVNRNF